MCKYQWVLELLLFPVFSIKHQVQIASMQDQLLPYMPCMVDLKYTPHFLKSGYNQVLVLIFIKLCSFHYSGFPHHCNALLLACTAVLAITMGHYPRKMQCLLMTVNPRYVGTVSQLIHFQFSAKIHYLGLFCRLGFVWKNMKRRIAWESDVNTVAFHSGVFASVLPNTCCHTSASIS